MTGSPVAPRDCESPAAMSPVYSLVIPIYNE